MATASVIQSTNLTEYERQFQHIQALKRLDFYSQRNISFDENETKDPVLIPERSSIKSVASEKSFTNNQNEFESINEELLDGINTRIISRDLAFLNHNLILKQLK
jgi:hypothetical protein